MKIAVLSRNKNPYSTYQLVEAAKEHGFEARILDVLSCYMYIASRKLQIHYKGNVVDG